MVKSAHEETGMMGELISQHSQLALKAQAVLLIL